MLLLLLTVLLLLTRLGLMLLLLLELLGFWLLTVDLLWRLFWLLGDLNDNVSWFTDNFGFETFFRVSGVSDGTDEAIRINDAVWSLDDISFTWFLAVLVVGEFFVFNIESELIWWAWLSRQKWAKINHRNISTPWGLITQRYVLTRPRKKSSISCENCVKSTIMRSLCRRECQQKKTCSHAISFFGHTHSIVMNSMQEVSGCCELGFVGKSESSSRCNEISERENLTY